jgi:hypothetical protein
MTAWAAADATGRSGAFGRPQRRGVAVNLRDDLPDAVSLLITLNVDQSSLAVRMGPAELAQAARVDPCGGELSATAPWCASKKGGNLKGA